MSVYTLCTNACSLPPMRPGRCVLKNLWHRAGAPDPQGSSGCQLSSPSWRLTGILLVNCNPSGSEPTKLKPEGCVCGTEHSHKESIFVVWFNNVTTMMPCNVDLDPQSEIMEPETRVLLLKLSRTDGCKVNLICRAGREPFVLSSAVKVIRMYVNYPALPSTIINVIRTGRYKENNNV